MEQGGQSGVQPAADPGAALSSTMLDLFKFAYAWLLPPGLFIVLLAVLGLMGLWRGWRGVKHVFLLALLIWVLSLRSVAGLLCSPLQESIPMPDQDAIASCDVLVMTGAGLVTGVPDVDGTGQPGPIMAKSMLAAFRLQKATGKTLVVSGGPVGDDTTTEADVALRIFEQMGIPEDLLVAENESLNTAQNARFTKRVLERLGCRRPLVISPALHAPRVQKLFEREGMDVVMFPSHHAVSRDRTFSLLRDLSPQMENLACSASALREHLAHLAIFLGLY